MFDLDLLSQHSAGSVSCADTGSTLDAPVLAPPHEFLSPEDTDVSSGAPSGVEQLASIRQKVTALLAKYNSTSTSTTHGAGDLVENSANQPVHTFSQDDYEVIDTPPLQKKARFVDSLNYRSDPNGKLDTSQTTFEDHPIVQTDSNIDEMDWDNGDFEEIAKQNLNFARSHKSGALRESMIQKDNAYVSVEKRDREERHVNGHVIEGFVRPAAREYVLVAGDESDYSDSLSVITERTEPEETQSDDSDHTMSAPNLSDSDIDLDQMFECNKNILDLHESDIHFMPIGFSAKQVRNREPSLKPKNLNNLSNTPATVNRGHSNSNVKKHGCSDVPVKAASKNHQTAIKSKSLTEKAAISTFHEGHEIKCEKYVCVSVSPPAAKCSKNNLKTVSSTAGKSDTELPQTGNINLHGKSVEMIDESHLKSVLQLQNLFNSKSPVRKPRVSKEYGGTQETEYSKDDLFTANTSQELSCMSDVPLKEYHKHTQGEPDTCKHVTLLATKLVTSAMNDAFVNFMTDSRDEKQNKQFTFKSPNNRTASAYERKDQESRNSVSVSGSFLSKNQTEHFLQEKSPLQTSSPVIRKKRKPQLMSHGIIHPAFFNQSFLKQHKSATHSKESDLASHSDFFSSTPAKTTAYSPTLQSSSNQPSPGASSRGSLGISRSSCKYSLPSLVHCSW